MPRWHNLAPGEAFASLAKQKTAQDWNYYQDILFPSGYPSSNLGRGVLFLKELAAILKR